MLKIAILSTFHSDKGFCGPLERQIRNSSHFLIDSDLLFVIHPSIQTPRINVDTLNDALQSSHHKIVLTSGSVITSQNGGSNAVPLLWKTLRSCLFFRPDFILYRTASDLLFRPGVSDLMNSFQFAVNSSPLCIRRSKWSWIPKLLKDPRVDALADVLGQEDPKLYVGRTECSFYKYQLWASMMDAFDQFILADPDYFLDASNHWPVEEVLFPTLAHLLGKKLGLLNYGKSLCYTKDAQTDGPINLNDIETLLDRGVYYSAKRFSSNPSDPAVLQLTNFKS